MEPGDAVFFHCNTLHRSDQNKSEKSRWAMICCYNAARNDPYKEHHHPRLSIPIIRSEQVSAVVAGNLVHIEIVAHKGFGVILGPAAGSHFLSIQTARSNRLGVR
jgi:hypothetical protein